MVILKDAELINVVGGALTGTLLNYIIKAATTIIDAGRTLGSALRRIYKGRMCRIS